MAIKYICRHCNATLGEFAQEHVHEAQLGLQFLTPGERRDIIAYNREGDITVKVVCDYCAQAISAHPELSLLPNPLQ